MKTLVLASIITLLVSTNVSPAFAARCNDKANNTVSETSTVGSPVARFFHAKRRLALKQAIDSTDTSKTNDVVVPSGNSLDYPTDSFIITD